MWCTICNGLISPTEESIVCGACGKGFHSDCWNENKGCGTPGCVNLPDISRISAESPEDYTYWGNMTKTCPACRETIKLSETVCPYCHEAFKTSAPLTRQELYGGYVKAPQPEIPGKKGAIAVFIFGLLGFAAPLNLLIGGIWFLCKSKSLKAAPIHKLLAVVGLLVSFLYIALVSAGIILSK